MPQGIPNRTNQARIPEQHMSNRAARTVPDLYCRAASSRARGAFGGVAENNQPSPQRHLHWSPAAGAGRGYCVGPYPVCSLQRARKFQHKRFQPGQRPRIYSPRSFWAAANRRRPNYRGAKCDQCTAPYYLPAPRWLGDLHRQSYRLALPPVGRPRSASRIASAGQLHGG